MRYFRVFASLFLLNIALVASELSYYSDQIYYKSDRSDGFVGFGNNFRVECNADNMVLVPKKVLPKDSSLTPLFSEIDLLKTSLKSDRLYKKTLVQLSKKLEYSSRSAKDMLSDTEILSNKMSLVQNRIDDNTFKLEVLKKRVAKSSLRVDAKAMYMGADCEDPTVVMNSYAVTIKPHLSAVVGSKTIELTQMLEFSNRSGVDIRADRGIFYTYAINEPLRVLEFYPWRVERASNLNNQLYMSEAAVIHKGITTRAVADTMSVKQLDLSRYELKDLDLKADGSISRIFVSKESVPFERLRVVYPYLDKRVYMTFALSPSHQIKHHIWTLVDSDRETKRALGRYEDGKYRLYAYVDHDVEVKRVVDVKRDSEGIFYGKEQKDGYTINITNHSDKTKQLRIVERIPLSTSDKIEVKDVVVKPKGVKYTIDKRGELVIDMDLKAKSTKKISVSFVVEHDKDIEINF